MNVCYIFMAFIMILIMILATILSMILILKLPAQVLILAQRGDWPGCEQAIKGLEKVPS